MDEASLSVPSTRPTETLDSPDHDENDISHHSIGNDNIDMNSKEQDESHQKNSLLECRKTGSLVDELDDDDYKCNDVRHVATADSITITNDAAQNKLEKEERSLNGNDQRSIEYPPTYTNHDNARDGTLPSDTTSVIFPFTKTKAAMQLPISNYILAQSRLATKSTPPPSWDHILRSGTQIKSLVADAIGEVKNTIISMHNKNHQTKRTRDEGHMDDDESPSANQRSRVVNVADFTVELAREKTAQVMQLQRQLKDAQAQAAVVQAANSSLREETCSGQSRLDRTIEALRIASNNATKARADADAAEATASTLAQSLQSLKTVLTETKRAAQILHQEQQELNATVSVAESQFKKKEAELLRAKQEIATLRTANVSLETNQTKFSQERECFVQQAKELEQELDSLKREKLELNTMEKARKDRFDKVEQEWRKAQTLLVEATSGQAAALQTQSALEKTIVALQNANEEVHASLKEQQRIARDDKHRLTESLGKVEKEAQRLRIAAEATEEEIARLKASKESADKTIQQLKSRLSNTERSLKEATIVATATTTPMSTNASSDTISTPIIPNQLSFQLPPLTTTSTAGKKVSSLISNSTTSIPTITEKENMGVQNGELCCVCYKPSIGIMKICQCGTKQCHKKAHTNCIKFMNTPAGPSVSHPGTPAPKLPIVLCDHYHNNNNSLPLTTSKLRSIQ